MDTKNETKTNAIENKITNMDIKMNTMQTNMDAKMDNMAA